MIEVNKRVGLKIRECRERYGWSQEQLALEANLHRAYVGQIERAEKNLGLKNLDKIARALDIPIEYLVKK